MQQSRQQKPALASIIDDQPSAPADEPTLEPDMVGAVRFRHSYGNIDHG
jgi:hypothetical protein